MWKSLIPGIHVDSDLDEEDKQKEVIEDEKHSDDDEKKEKDEAHVFLVVRTKATTRNEEDELELKIPVYENLAYVRKEIFDVCHGQDADPITFTEDLMATTPMNIIVDRENLALPPPNTTGLGWTFGLCSSKCLCLSLVVGICNCP